MISKSILGHLKKRLIGFLAASCEFLGLAGPLHSQPYTNRPITIIVPAAPSTGPDLRARLYMQRLGERWGVPVVVENRVGASGNIGIAAVAEASGDGRTLLMTGGSYSINPVVNKVPYDPLKSFAPVILTSNGYSVLAVSSNTRARNLKEFIADAKTKPGDLTYASPGNGSVQHLSMELFKLNAGINVTHVPYKGAADAIRDVATGNVNAMFMPGESIVPLVQGGRVRVLAVLGQSRNPLFPAVTTFTEDGFAGFNVRSWIGLMAPASTSADIVRRLNAELNIVLNLPDILESVLKRTGVPDDGGGTPERLADIVRTDLEMWTRLVATTGIKAD